MPTPLSETASLLSDAQWQALASRDRGADGSFFYAVTTTGVFCKPSCPGRPLRKNVLAFECTEQALMAGFRPCKRCRPLG